MVGPTSVGKTAVACQLAEMVSGVLISCDSMQIYQEIQIANNKPSASILRRYPHRMINLASVAESFDVAKFRLLAVKEIEAALDLGKVPIIVGGSGLYVNVLLDGIFSGPQRDSQVRANLEKIASAQGPAYLYAQLQKLDPAAAEKIHSNDLRRIVRALEVLQISKKPISGLQKTRKGIWDKYAILFVGLNRPRPELYERINRRVEEMFEEGVVAEIEDLFTRPLGVTASKLIGLKEIGDYLNKKCSLAEARETMQMNTRRYAKRQLTWFRKDKRISWLEWNSQMSVKEMAQSIKEMLGALC